MVLCSWDLPPQTPQPSLIKRKVADKFPEEGIRHTRPAFLKTGEVITNKGGRETATAQRSLRGPSISPDTAQGASAPGGGREAMCVSQECRRMCEGR